MGGHSPVVVIWRYSPDSHARPVRATGRCGEGREGRGEGMRKCDDCTIGKECQAGGADGCEKVN
jgi:hypothetical protein